MPRVNYNKWITPPIEGDPEDYLTFYTSKDIQRIFALESLTSARRLMNSPGFPSMRVGRGLRVTRHNLLKYISQNEKSKIYI